MALRATAQFLNAANYAFKLELHVEGFTGTPPELDVAPTDFR